MAVVWCDPYLSATVGGAAGTTGSGSGTYASPYSLSDLSSGTSLSAGDEIRLKGFAESAFWDANYSLTTSTTGGNVYQYSGSTSFANSFVRIKTNQTQRLLRKYVYGTYQKTPYNASTWDDPVPLLDETYGYDTFDADYIVTASNFLYSSVPNRVTVTAGWTSETEQNGVTIIVTTSGFYFGPNVTTDVNGNPVDWDAPELHIISSGRPDLYGNEINIGTFCGGSASSGSRLFSTSHCTIDNYIRSGYNTYPRFYNYQSSITQVNIKFNFFSATYYNRPMFNSNKSASATPYKLYIGEWMLNSVSSNYFILNSGSHYIDIELMTNYYTLIGIPSGRFYMYSGLSGTYTENSTTISNEFTWAATVSNIILGGGYLLGDSSKPYNTSVTSASQSLIFSSSPFDLFLAGTYTYNYNRAVIYTLAENGSTTLENMDFKIAESINNYTYGAPLKVTFLADEESGRPLQIMFATTYTTSPYPILVFRSSTFSDKLTWHFTSHTNGGIYSDTFALDLPSYASGDLTFAASFTTSSTPGVTVRATIVVIKDDGTDYSFTQQTATGSGTSLSISQTLSSSTLTSQTAQSAYVILEMEKTSTAVANIAINSMAIS